MDNSNEWSAGDSEWARLQTLAGEIVPNMVGKGRFNFVLEPYEEAVVRENEVFIRATVLDKQGGLPLDVQWSSGRSNKALLKMRLAEWNLWRVVQGPLKVLNVGVQWVGAWVLDATEHESVVVATAKIEDSTSISAAEFFAGAFMGWSQAAYMLHRLRVPLSVDWGIERNPECMPMQQCQSTNVVVTNAYDMCAPDSVAAEYVSLLADVRDHWWLRMFAIRPVQVAVVSAPCPPWSRAAGLLHADGQLLLRVADICGALEIPVVVLEQVDNFPNHRDFQAVCRAWSLSGYEVRWQQTLDTQAILPAARKRHLMVFCHRKCPQGFALPAVGWGLTGCPTLRSSQVLLELPPAVVPNPATFSVERIS